MFQPILLLTHSTYKHALALNMLFLGSDVRGLPHRLSVQGGLRGPRCHLIIFSTGSRNLATPHETLTRVRTYRDFIVFAEVLTCSIVEVAAPELLSGFCTLKPLTLVNSFYKSLSTPSQRYRFTSTFSNNFHSF